MCGVVVVPIKLQQLMPQDRNRQNEGNSKRKREGKDLNKDQ